MHVFRGHVYLNSNIFMIGSQILTGSFNITCQCLILHVFLLFTKHVCQKYSCTRHTQPKQSVPWATIMHRANTHEKQSTTHALYDTIFEKSLPCACGILHMRQYCLLYIHIKRWWCTNILHFPELNDRCLAREKHISIKTSITCFILSGWLILAALGIDLCHAVTIFWSCSPFPIKVMNANIHYANMEPDYYFVQPQFGYNELKWSKIKMATP